MIVHEFTEQQNNSLFSLIKTKIIIHVAHILYCFAEHVYIFYSMCYQVHEVEYKFLM